MDAAVAMDAKTASPATWKTAQNAVSHSAHPHYSLHALHTKNLTLPFPRLIHPCYSVFFRGLSPVLFRVFPWLIHPCYSVFFRGLFTRVIPCFSVA